MGRWEGWKTEGRQVSRVRVCLHIRVLSAGKRQTQLFCMKRVKECLIRVDVSTWALVCLRQEKMGWETHCR